MMNNKTSPTVSIEITNAQAIISPQNSGQNELASGIPAQSGIFAGLSILTLNGIRQRIFGTRQNEEATEEVSKALVSNMKYMLILYS